MSVEALAIALHHSRATGAALLVLLGIANHDGDGGAWPSIATLAKYARVHPRNVQRASGRLEQLGEIRRAVQRGGTAATEHHERPNLYHVVLKCPPGCDGTRNHRVTPPAPAPPPGAGATRPPGASATLTIHSTNQVTTHSDVTIEGDAAPVDTSICWNRHSSAFVHLAPVGARGRDVVACDRCGVEFEVLPSLADVMAAMRS